MKEIVYHTISEKCELKGFPPPENPFFNIAHIKLKKNEIDTCTDDTFEPVRVIHCFYVISFKNIISGEISYGRTK